MSSKRRRQADTVCAACASLPGVTVDNTFGDQTNLYRIAGKIFAFVDVEAGSSVALKVQPDDGEALRSMHHQITPGYHLNKRHWVSVALEQGLAMPMVLELVEDSYRLVCDGLPKRLRPE